MNPYYQDESVTIYHGDCLEVLHGISDCTADLIVTDPPYFKVKAEAWDRQWDKPVEFLAWLGVVADEWARVMAPNGSLYCFASPQMAARVEAMLSARVEVLNHITWNKPSGRWNLSCKDDLRAFFPASERAIFCEHSGSDNTAKGEAGYAAKCDELRGFVFEPLRAYLSGEWERAGLTPRDANEACGNQMAGHYFTQSQWALPTADNYRKLRERANNTGGDYLRREYEDLRREYEDLRREYEDIRRPFSVTAQDQYTDVWTFPAVQHYPGKHPCEKPQALLRHMIKASSRDGAIVLDSFMGTGSTGIAAKALCRRFVGIEIEEKYCEIAAKRMAQEVLL